MADETDVQSYFEENAESWLLDAYEQSGYNYPTPFHRLRVVKDIFRELDSVEKVVDVGCGGGQLAFALADQGYQVHGIDQSREMLEHAESQLAQKDAQVLKRVSFSHGTMDEIEDNNYDALTAMGLIGYLPSDDSLFSVASRVLRQGGYLVVSFRNRLFNLYSLSARTLKEVEEGQFVALAQEALSLYGQIGNLEIKEFLRQLNTVTSLLLSDESLLSLSTQSPSMKRSKTYSSSYEARQTTPQQARDVAQKWGFQTLSLRGVHPHLLVPSMNELLPPQVYNRLSDSLIPLESTPLGLLWSSVFIGVFQVTSS